MKRFEASVTIDKPAAEVWSVLVNTPAWPEWDPHCDRIEGKVAVGEKLAAFTKLAPGRGFSVKVAEMVENERMVWSSKMPFGLFAAERTFELVEERGRTRFTTREVMKGPMLALIGKSIPNLDGPFADFAAGLKRRVEG